MGYSATSDVSAFIPSATLSGIAGIVGVSSSTLVTAAIADSDAEIDLWASSGWGTTAKLAASRWLSVERVYSAGGFQYPAPQIIRDLAAKWRDLLQMREGVSGSVIYDPTRNETSDELNRLNNGDL